MVISDCYSEYNYTVVVLPDTQYYSAYYQENFYQQTDWICQCASEYDIIYASHLGDIVEHNNIVEQEWKVAKSSMDTLFQCDVPNGILPGNHDPDYSIRDEDERFRLFDDTFPVSTYKQKNWFGGSMDGDNMRNNYAFVTAPDGTEYIFINLEYLPGAYNSSLKIEWADNLLTTYHYKKAIISTHFAGSDCSDSPYYPLVQLVNDHCNVVFVTGGHVFYCGGEMVGSVVDGCGNNVFFLISNYQNRASGGTTWLRYYSFQKNNRVNRVCAFTFSPYLGEYETDNNSYFSIDFNNNNTLEGGCDIIECLSDYVSPSFIMSNITMISIILLLFMHILDGITE